MILIRWMFDVGLAVLMWGAVAGSDCSDQLVITYPSGVVKCNQKISIDQGAQMPTVEYKEADPNALYLLVMVDPDAPKPANPTMKYWRHWLVKDIKGSDLKAGSLNSGDVLTAYAGPTPPAGPAHRYQFFLYKQSGLTLTGTPAPDASRGKWDFDGFIENNALKHLLAASFQFKAKINELKRK